MKENIYTTEADYLPLLADLQPGQMITWRVERIQPDDIVNAIRAQYEPTDLMLYMHGTRIMIQKDLENGSTGTGGFRL